MGRGGAGHNKGKSGQGQGRPSQPGARYPSGQIKPDNSANPVVAAQRRALLGIDPSVEKADLSAAENALDLARARGWLSPERHKAAGIYATLTRRVVVGMPKFSASNQDRAPPIDRVQTPADMAYAQALRRHEAGQITDAQMAKAEKEHLYARVDWAKLPPRDLSRIFDAMLSLPDFWADPTADATDPEVDKLRRIKAALTDAHLRELFDTCVAGSWPMWVIFRANGTPADKMPAHWDRKRLLLEEGLDVVIREAMQLRPERPEKSPSALNNQIGAPPSASGTKVEQALAFVDEDGEPVEMRSEHGRPFDVSRLVRLRGGQP